MDTTIEEPRYRNHPETHPEIVTRLQRAGTLDFSEAVRRGIRPPTPRLTFRTLSTNERLAVVRKLIHLTGYRDAAPSISYWHGGPYGECWYVMPERLALAISRLTQFVAGMPEPLPEWERLLRALWWKLDSVRRMDEANAKVRAAYAAGGRS